MILGIDIGGTKTLLASFTDDGVLGKTYKFPTPKSYPDFLSQITTSLPLLGVNDFLACGVGVPGVLDRPNGRIVGLGNLPWKDEKIESDIEKIVNCPVKIENDAKLAGLSEAILLNNQYERVLYITFSTGIGISLIVNNQIDSNISDRGGHGILLEHHGKVQIWEDFASGKAIVAKYGKRASEIDSKAVWKEIVGGMAIGIFDLITILEPDVVVIGGGVGANFPKFGDLLVDKLKTFEMPVSKIPPVIQAKNAEEAVIYGCYYLTKELLHNR
jgi:beta-glucoside kinase